MYSFLMNGNPKTKAYNKMVIEFDLRYMHSNTKHITQGDSEVMR